MRWNRIYSTTKIHVMGKPENPLPILEVKFAFSNSNNLCRTVTWTLQLTWFANDSRYRDSAHRPYTSPFRRFSLNTSWKVNSFFWFDFSASINLVIDTGIFSFFEPPSLNTFSIISSICEKLLQFQYFEDSRCIEKKIHRSLPARLFSTASTTTDLANRKRRTIAAQALFQLDY